MAAISAAAEARGPSANRNLVRTIYAAIEGVAWLFADHVASVAKDTADLTAAEELALSERGYQVTTQGKVTEQVRFIALPSLIRLAANIASRIDPEFKVDFGTDEWNRFLRGLAVRNRITHPKTSKDLEVSGAEVAMTIAALHWSLELTERGMKLTVDALRNYNEQISNLVKNLEAGDPETWEEYLLASKEFGA